jgi:chemosensory pili system protein ChpA (sensor histidine kinase/response regulator)
MEHALPEALVPAIMPADAAALLAASAGISDELDSICCPSSWEGADLLPQIGEALRSWQQHPHDSGQAQMLLRTLHTVKGSARMAGAMRLGQHAHEIETHIENMLHAGTATPQAFEECWPITTMRCTCSNSCSSRCCPCRAWKTRRWPNRRRPWCACAPISSTAW